MRSYAAKISNPRSELQQDHRQKIAVTMKYLKPLMQFLKIEFKNYAGTMTEMNSAMAWNYHNALQGTYPNNTIDYSTALVARGNLAPVLNQAVIFAGLAERTDGTQAVTAPHSFSGDLVHCYWVSRL